MPISTTHACLVKIVYELREEMLNAAFRDEVSDDSYDTPAAAAIQAKLAELNKERAEVLEGVKDSEKNPIDILIEADAFKSIKNKLAAYRDQEGDYDQDKNASELNKAYEALGNTGGC